MRILALDQSAAQGSLAVLADEDVLAERSWRSVRGAGKPFFDLLRQALVELHMELDAFDLFAAGLGPGSFSGLRVGLAIVQALALPGRKPVAGVSSGEAVAWDIFLSRPAATAVVVGDARRDRLWMAAFAPGDPAPRRVMPYDLVRPELLPALIPEGSVVATPDWTRLGPDLEKLLPDRPGLLREPRFPRAASIGRLAARKHRAGLPTDELKPLYLHPPVRSGIEPGELLP